MSRGLFTIGYEGHDLDSFITLLKNNFINLLIDVRRTPISRKRGFSKSSLSEKLKSENINYIHFRELGSPKSMRERLKLTGDYSSFFEKMEEYLQTQSEAIELAYNYAITNRSCLMCFEHLARSCHRKIVADRIKQRDGNGLKINHI